MELVLRNGFFFRLKHATGMFLNGERFEADLIQYFKLFPSRNKVEYFVSDMNPHFRAVTKACIPKATIVADRYHVVRQAIRAMECVRKEEQKKLSAHFRRYFKRSRYLLSRKRDVESGRKLADWLVSVEMMELLEFKDCTKACHNWFQEILNAIWIVHGQTASPRGATTKRKSGRAAASGISIGFETESFIAPPPDAP